MALDIGCGLMAENLELYVCSIFFSGATQGTYNSLCAIVVENGYARSGSCPGW